MPTEILRYPSDLLKIETGQQFKQLSLFDEHGTLKPQFNSLNSTVSQMVQLNDHNSEKSFLIQFPNEIEEKISDKIKRHISKEITANELRVLTAVLGLAQRAFHMDNLHFIEKINRAFFEFKTWELYEYAGLAKNKSGAYDKYQKELVRDALSTLDKKRFCIPVYAKDNKIKSIKVDRLVQIHEFELWNQSEIIEKNQTFKLTIHNVFFELSGRRTYFHLPANLNRKLRSITKGRPNAGVELFIKHLYQALHCSKTNSVEYSYTKLCEIMNLFRHQKNKHHSRIKKTIDKAFDTAQKIGLIDEVVEGTGKYGGIKYTLTFHQDAQSNISLVA
jgi:hypothetical protein